MASTPCSVCDEEIEVAGRVRLGQKIACSHCGAELEVITTEPLELEAAQDDDDELWDEDEIEEDELTAALDEEIDDLEDVEGDEEDDIDDLEELDDFEDELEDDFDDDDFDDFDDDDFDDEDGDEDEDGDDDRWR